MKLTVEKKTLSEALASVDRVVEGRVTVPLLGNVLLDANEGLTITGTNLDMEMRVHIDAEVETAGTTTVPSSLLAKLARTLPADSFGNLTLAMDADDQELQIIGSARSHYRLPTLPADDFSIMQGPDDTPSTLTMPGNTFSTLLRRGAHAMDTSETRFYLKGVHMHLVAHSDQPGLVAVSTDGKRLAKYRMPAPEGATEDMPSIIIHDGTVRHLIHWLEDYEDNITLQIDGRKIAVEAGPNRLTAKLVDGDFPDYERVIPQNNSLCLDVDTPAIAAAITRIKALDSGKESGALILDLTRDMMCLRARTADCASAREEITVDYSGDDFQIGFTIDLAAAIFSAAPGKTAKLYLEDNGAPALIIPDDVPEMSLVLMGRRI